MKQFLIYLSAFVIGLVVFAYLVDNFVPAGCPNPKCCQKSDKTFEEDQVCDQGT